MTELRKLRKLARLTQTQCARRAGIPASKLCLIETGEVVIGTREEAKLQRVLLKIISIRARLIEAVLAEAQ